MLRTRQNPEPESSLTLFQHGDIKHIHICDSCGNALVPKVHTDLLPNTRREFLGQAASSVVAPLLIGTQPVHALEGCGRASHNCIRTAWVAPESITTPSGVAETIRAVLNTYPQTGQSGVDCGGWKIINDALESDAAIITLEFKSCVGPAAVAINLGQPFIDDLKLEIGKDTTGNMKVNVLSKSRMGSSDLSVNRKRLIYLGNKLKEKGWIVPEPKYPYEMSA